MTKVTKSRRWPLRGYLLLFVVLFLGVGLLRNQGSVSHLFQRAKQYLVPVVKVFRRDDGVAVHVESGATKARVETHSQVNDSKETIESQDQKLAEILEALVRPSPPETVAEPETAHKDMDVSSPDEPKNALPAPAEGTKVVSTISCQVSSDFAKALYSGDFKQLRKLMTQGCLGASAEERESAVDALVQNGPGTYFKLIKLHQQKRLLIHRFMNRDNGLASRVIAIQSDEELKKVDPIGAALEDFDFARAKQALIQLMDRKRSPAKELGPLLRKIDAYAKFQDFVGRKCKSERMP